jgi:hypothetical protein
MGKAAGHGGWAGAEVIPSISPNCSGADMKMSSACSLAAGADNWLTSFHIVQVGQASWP